MCDIEHVAGVSRHPQERWDRAAARMPAPAKIKPADALLLLA
jgi:hypothetical protein